jgi:isopenicillin-N epimerase
MKEHWQLDPAITFLNHGSFGATPRLVLARQQELRDQMEAEPVRFFVRELEPLLDEARATLAGFVGAQPADIAFVQNATAGVNAVLRSLDLDKFDELVVTSHEYVASRNALDYVAQIAGSKVVAVDVPFPITSSEEIVAGVLASVTERTRLVLVDHVTSPTGIIFPIEALARELSQRGIDMLVDGAHAPGMLPLQLEQLGVAYYTGNLHKWVCAPKGAAFLYVRRNRRATIRPTSISHGASATRRDRSRFHLEFDWIGTIDPSPWLSVPRALEVMASLLPGGWPEVRQRNHALALRARDILCERLSIEPAAPDSMLGSLAALPIPDATASAPVDSALQDALLERYGIEVPIVPWPAAPHRLVRISAQLYNEEAEYARLADALITLRAEGL